MKKLLLLLLSLMMFSCFGNAETNDITITLSASFTATQTFSNVFTISSDPVISVVVTTNNPPPIDPLKLLSEIKQIEEYLNVLTNDVPVAYAGWTSDGARNVINYYSNVWYCYRVNLTNLIIHKETFKQIMK